AGTALDRLVAIRVRQGQALRGRLTDGRLAAAGHPDQRDRQAWARKRSCGDRLGRSRRRREKLCGVHIRPEKRSDLPRNSRSPRDRRQGVAPTWASSSRSRERANPRPTAATLGAEDSARRRTFGDELGSQEDQQLGLARSGRPGLEEVAEIRHVAEPGHLGDVLAVLLLEDATDDDSTAVLDQDLSLDVLGIDREARGRRAANAVLGDIDVEDDVPLGRDLRRDLELEVGLAELQRCRTARRRDLIRQLLALLDQRLLLV